MSEKRIQATIPEPYEDVASLYRSVQAMKELVETLAGQRGRPEDRAATLAELPPHVDIKADSAWNPFPYINGWVDYAAPYSPCGFRKLSTGLVLLRGLVQNGTAAQICVLPAGYRPSIRHLFTVMTTPANICRIDVDPTGSVSHTGGAAGWISLSGIQFLSEG